MIHILKHTLLLSFSSIPFVGIEKEQKEWKRVRYHSWKWMCAQRLTVRWIMHRMYLRLLHIYLSEYVYVLEWFLSLSSSIAKIERKKYRKTVWKYIAHKDSQESTRIVRLPLLLLSRLIHVFVSSVGWIFHRKWWIRKGFHVLRNDN